MGAPRGRSTPFAIPSFFLRLIRQNTSKYVKIRQNTFLGGSEFRHTSNMSKSVLWVGCLAMGYIFRSCGICGNGWQSLQTFRTHQILTLQTRMLNFLCCFPSWDQISAAPPGSGMMPGHVPDSLRTVALKSSSLPSPHCQGHSTLKDHARKQIKMMFPSEIIMHNLF